MSTSLGRQVSLEFKKYGALFECFAQGGHFS